MKKSYHSAHDRAEALASVIGAQETDEGIVDDRPPRFRTVNTPTAKTWGRPSQYNRPDAVEAPPPSVSSSGMHPLIAGMLPKKRHGDSGGTPAAAM